MVRKGYKQTEVGAIPEDWELCTVGECFNFKNGLNKEKRYFGYGTPIINYMDVFNHTGIGKLNIKGKVDVTKEEIRAYSAILGDVFFTRTSETVDEIGAASTLVEKIDDAVFSGFVLRARPKNNRFSLYFKKYCFSSEIARKQITSTSSYTTRALTNGKLLSEIKVPVPTRDDEQKEIAGALSDIDNLISSLEKLIAKKRDIQTATMQQLLTGKKRLPCFGEGKGYKQTELGEIPEDWCIQPLGKILKIRHGKSQKEVIKPDGLYPILATGGEIGRTNTVLYSKPSVLIGRKGTIDVPYFMDTPFWTVDTLFYSEISEQADAKFLYYKFLFINWYQYNEASGVPSLNAATIEKIVQTLPQEKKEQEAISKLLTDFDLEVSMLQARLKKTKAIKQGMMQELLTGRTRLVNTEENIVPITKAAKPKHNWQFNEAVVISVLAQNFGSEKFPLGRKRYTKLSYLLHRYHEGKTQDYLKKAAGPYNPKTKYQGPEKIAIENNYIQQHSSGKFNGFIAADNIDKAHNYFSKWYGREVLDWLEQFRFQKNDTLELLTTVDMAACELASEGKSIELQSVKTVIQENKDWAPKLDRSVFSDDNIVKAIEESYQLLCSNGGI